MSEQFADAPEDTSLKLPSKSDNLNSTREVTFVHDSDLEWSESEEGSQGNHYTREYNEEDAKEDEREWAAENYDIDDEDWEIAENDFTKQYNRLRLHNTISQGNAPSNAPSAGTGGAILPAINRSKPTRRVITNASNSAGSMANGAIVTKDALAKKMSDQLTALSKYSSRMANIDAPYPHIGTSSRPGAAARDPFTLGASINPKGPSATANQKDKSDRATTENVLDPRTRIILYKMIGRGLIKEINGCVSTGKEANVYHALAGSLLTDPPANAPNVPPSFKPSESASPPNHLALKVYKTSILTFRDRDRYISGEHRFMRSGYSRHNPRKMVRMWAEKEMRNLKRLHAAGIPCPEVWEVRQNVLVMSFVGDTEGWASPRLKDATIPAEEYHDLYQSLMLSVRKMYHVCKLVHADLSEYNILYHQESRPPPILPSASQPGHDIQTETEDPLPTAGKGTLYIIDVSQSVEHDHPSAYDFLRSDLKNIQRFFEGWGVRCLGLRRAFDFVTRDTLSTTSATEYGGGEETLRAWIQEEASKKEQRQPQDGEDPDMDEERETELEKETAANKATEDSVFLNTFIPRNLNEVTNPERMLEAHQKAIENEKKEPKPTKVRFDNVPKQEHETDEDSGEEEDDRNSGEQSEDEFQDKKPRGHRHEDRGAKKERKKAVKEEQREKRKTKMPKAEKKKRIKNSRGG